MRVAFDMTGFVLVALFLGALEVVLDRGQVEDWFGSHFIVAFTVISALAFLLMIPWEITRKNPLVDLRMVASRQFGACFVVMGATGAILLATTQFMPQLVQDDYGYTATWAGLVLSPGGVVAMVMMFVTGRLSQRVQPKYLIAVGAASRCAFDAGPDQLDERSRLLVLRQGAHDRQRRPAADLHSDHRRLLRRASQDKTDMASALLNAARNTGGSIGVSLASNVLAHREQFHQSRLAESVIPSSISYQQTLDHMTQFFVAQGSSLVQAKQQAFAWIGQQVAQQASLLAYTDVFWALMLVSLGAIPLALMLRKVKLGGAAPMGH